jgi:tetratricopeptide (TPR) repeat protein
MNKPLTVIIFLILSTNIFSQENYIYKRNPLSGKIEVFKSQNGLPVGQPLYRMSTNIYGYLEFEGLNPDLDPYSRKPDYRALQKRQPYNLPVQDIINTIETLNTNTEYQSKTSNKYNNLHNDLKEQAQFRHSLAESHLNFFNSFYNKPKTIKDGWHKVVKLFLDDGISALNISQHANMRFGLVKVINNKIIEFYENIHTNDDISGTVYHKYNLQSNFTISNCLFEPSKTETVLFYEYLINPSKEINEPLFSFLNIHQENPKSSYAIIIAKNKYITKNNKGGDYYVGIIQHNPLSLDCTNSNFKIAIEHSETDFYGISMIDITDNNSIDIEYTINNYKTSLDYCQRLIIQPNGKYKIEQQEIEKQPQEYINQLVSQKKYKEAEIYLDNLIKENPGNEYYLANKSSYLYTIGNYSEALKTLDRAIAISTPENNFYQFRANINYSLGNKKEALVDITKVIQYDSNNTQAYFSRAVIKSELNDLYGVINDLKTLLTKRKYIDTTSINIGTIYNNMGYAYLRLRDYPNAEKNLIKASTLSPNENYIWGSLGRLYYETNQVSKAITCLNKSISLLEEGKSFAPSTDPGMPYYYLGLLYLKSGKKALGCTNFSKAMELEYKDAAAAINKYCQ